MQFIARQDTDQSLASYTKHRHTQNELHKKAKVIQVNKVLNE